MSSLDPTESEPLFEEDDFPLEPEADLEEETRHLGYAFAKRHQIVLGEKKDNHLHVFCGPKVTHLMLAELRRAFKLPLKIELLDQAKFDEKIQEAYEQGSNEARQMAGELGEELDLQSVAQELAEPEDLLEAQDDAPIIRLINALLTEAIKAEASDIHIEPYENRLVVRMRVDGVLQEVLEQQKTLTPLIVSRIKVMAKLDIAEKRIPQDGRISLRVAGRAVDVRVSTLPSGHGERVVMRLLDKQAGRLDLEQLGMDPESLEVMKHIIARPHGIILVTGPTGSGKTTSLYAVLARLNNRRRNIMTVED
ncbi:MAG: ATPase, T2SS/T4P/T4SS family, partial [Gammaproteobacteria bacterium]|nr:ATPase, T2SS/T4P/T4SS family [Gammaproteobacteria bacterium]